MNVNGDTHDGPQQRGAPVRDVKRIDSIDVLRGFAVLGILVMNIQLFTMVDAAYSNPTAFGDLTGANYTVWYLSHLLCNGKFITIFSMLFGAGVLLMTDRQEAKGLRPASLHYRRMGVLLVIGLMHAYLLWFGDVLYSYAMCGFGIYLLRKLPPWSHLCIGLTMYTIPFFVMMVAATFLPLQGETEMAEAMEQWQPTAAAITEQVATYRSGWVTQMPHRATSAFKFQTLFFVIMIVWFAGGLMLMGMALYRWGVFSATRSRAFYVTLVAIAATVGIPTVIAGVRRNEASGWDFHYAKLIGSQFNLAAAPLVSLGWIGLVMLACKQRALHTALRPLAAVGRMALTNYLMHSVICTFIAYGNGLGKFGSLDRVEQISIVAGVWVFQLIASPIWLRYCYFGPAEWLWRSLSYLRRQPMWRRPMLPQPALEATTDG